jgi:hypothetical protein
MGKIIKTASTAIMIVMLLASCVEQAELPKTDQPPADNGQVSEEIITDLSNPIWIGKDFKLYDAVWKFANYEALPAIGEAKSSKGAYHKVDLDIKTTTPLNLGNIRFEMVDVFGNKFQPVTDPQIYAGIKDRIMLEAIPIMSSLDYKVVIIFDGLQKTQGLSIEILDKTTQPEQRIALIDMGI